MKTNYTQGIWHAKDGQIYPEETGKTLASIPYFDPENEEMQANAQLIASAPTLLRLLQDAREILLHFTEAPDFDSDMCDTYEEISRALDRLN